MSAGRSRAGMCLDCLLLKELKARDLCSTCYWRLFNRGVLDQFYPRKTRRLADVLEDWEIYRARGLSKRQASVLMGYAEKSLERLLSRAERRRDDTGLAA